MRIKLIKPKLEELNFRQRLLADEETMTYNHAWGGTIEWPRHKWKGLLCSLAKENCVTVLYDDIAIDNPGIVFLKTDLRKTSGRRK